MKVLALHFPKLLLQSEQYVLAVADGFVFMSNESLDSDRDTFEEIFFEDEYSTDYRGAVVIDLGAHKGYYGAYALLKGASAVVSYEPEARNFEFATRAARTFKKCGLEWVVHRSAVGAEEGVSELHISTLSWSHSLVMRPNKGRRRTLRIEHVPTMAMSRILECAASGSGQRLVVKMDVEGAECDVVLGTTQRLWRCVDEIFVEVHPFAPCPANRLVEHLHGAGFAIERKGQILRGTRGR